MNEDDKMGLSELAEKADVSEEDAANLMIEVVKDGWLFSTHVSWPESSYMSELNENK